MIRTAVFLSLLAPSAALAQTSSVTAQLSSSTGVTDNANLESDDQAVGDGFSTISPSLVYERLGRRVIHRLSYRFDYQLYFENSEANSYSNQANWGGLFLLSRNVRLSLNANVAQGETNNFSLVSEQAGVDAGADGGVKFVSGSVSQGLTWEMSPVWRSGETLAVRTFYPIDSPDDQPQGYDIASVLSVNRIWQQNSLGLRYNTDVFVEDANQVITGPELVYRRDLGPFWTAEASAGVQALTRTDDVNLSYQPTAAISARYQTERRASVRAGYARDSAPNLIVGEVFVNDQLEVTGSYPLMQRERLFINGALGAQRGRQLDLDGNDVGGDSYVYLADASLSWEVRNNLALSLRYQYRNQDADEGSSLTSFTSNTVLVSIGGTYPSRTRRQNPLRGSSRVDGSDANDPFGNVNREQPRPRNP